MKYITYKQSEGGRSGHKLQDIFSAYIFSFLIRDLEVYTDPSWQNQHILKFEPSPVINFENIVKVKKDHKYFNGTPFSVFKEIEQEIKIAPESSLIELHGVIRIHPFQLTQWYQEGLINEDLFILKFIPEIRQMYYKDQDFTMRRCLSMHIRRGDIADRNNPVTCPKGSPKKMFWPLEYYDNQICCFRAKHPDVPIYIFSEKIFSEDLFSLKRHSNLELILGDYESLKSDIASMINSQFFMPCNSSLSKWISYISRGKIIFPKNKYIKFFHKQYIW